MGSVFFWIYCLVIMLRDIGGVVIFGKIVRRSVMIEVVLVWLVIVKGYGGRFVEKFVDREELVKYGLFFVCCRVE